MKLNSSTALILIIFCSICCTSLCHDGLYLSNIIVSESIQGLYCADSSYIFTLSMNNFIERRLSYSLKIDRTMKTRILDHVQIDCHDEYLLLSWMNGNRFEMRSLNKLSMSYSAARSDNYQNNPNRCIHNGIVFVSVHPYYIYAYDIKSLDLISETKLSIEIMDITCNDGVIIYSQNSAYLFESGNFKKLMSMPRDVNYLTLKYSDGNAYWMPMTSLSKIVSHNSTLTNIIDIKDLPFPESRYQIINTYDAVNDYLIIGMRSENYAITNHNYVVILDDWEARHCTFHDTDGGVKYISLFENNLYGFHNSSGMSSLFKINIPR